MHHCYIHLVTLFPKYLHTGCACVCGMDIEQITTRVKEIRRILLINKRSTVKSKLSKISASDERTSARVTGAILSISILGSIIAWILLPDLYALMQILFSCRRSNNWREKR